MKYVILTNSAGARELRVGFGFDCSHRALAQPLLLRGYDATSAGFFYFSSDGVAVTYGISEGLRLGPADGDALYIGRLNELSLRTAPKPEQAQAA